MKPLLIEKTNSLLTLFVFVFLTVFTGIVGAANREEIRDLEGVTEVRVAGSLSVVVKQSDQSQLRVSGPEDAIPQVISKVSGNSVSITYDDSWLDYYADDVDELVIEVSLPLIEGLSLSGSGDIVVEDIHTSTLKASVQGSGDMAIGNLVAKKVSLAVLGSGDLIIEQMTAIDSKASIRGSGTIGVAGEVQSQSISIMGSGDFEGENLSVELANGKIMGSGDAVFANAERRNFSVLGSGEFRVIN